MRVLLPVQALRALAAAGVVIGHFQSYTATPTTQYWFPYDKLAGAGVDVFFVLSGFIMVYSSAAFYGRFSGPGKFLARRIIRIVPLYWLCTTIYVLIAAAFPNLDVHYSIDFLTKSYFFIPVVRANGAFNPVVGQGWTLDYELLFYAVFALALFAPRLKAIATASLALIGIAAAGAVLAPSSVVLRLWSDPIILEFVLGMAVGLAYCHVRRVPRWLNAGLVFAAIAAFWIDWEYVALPQFIGGGLPAALLIAGATLGDLAPSGRFWRIAGILGNASYAVYLFHAFSIHGTISAFHWRGVDIEPHRTLCLITAVCATFFMAIAIYYGFEKPVTKGLHSRFGSGSRLSPMRPTGVAIAENAL